MRTFLLSLSLLLISLTSVAQDNTQQQIDSLRKAAASQHGVEKVQTYLLLNSYLSETASLEEMLDFYDEFENIILQEQKKEKNNDLIPVYRKKYATKLLNVVVTLYNFSEYDKAEKQARETMAYCLKNNEWVSYYKGYNLLLDVLMVSLKYETVQREAKKLYEETKAREGQDHTLGMVFATASLAEVYKKQDRFEEAEKYYRECIALASKTDFTGTCYILVDVHFDLVRVLMEQGKYKETLLALKKAEQVVKKLTELETAGGYYNPITRSYLYECYFDYYLAVKDLDKAEYYCKLVEETRCSFSDGEIVFDGDILMIRAEILEARGKYAEALEAIEKYQRWALDFGDTPGNTNDILLIKARLLIRVGKGNESIALYDSVITNSNRIRNLELNAQLDELRTIYEVDKHITEKEKNRNYFLFAMGGCLLLVLLLSFYIYYNQQIKKKNKALYRQIKEQERLATALRRIAVQSDKVEDFEEMNTELLGNLQQQKLVSRLHDFLLRDNNFTKPDINSDELASALATNRTTLYKAIKAVAEKTLQEYIQSLRMEEAKRMLETCPELTIDTIVEDCGFSSRSAFYRKFSEQYNISPAEYRKLAKKN